MKNGIHNKKKIIVFSATPKSNHSIKMLEADQRNSLELWSCDGSDGLYGLNIKRNWSNDFIGLINLFAKLRTALNCGACVNIQHEFNVYGGTVGLLVLPFFFLLLPGRITLTLHSYIQTSKINGDFLRRFRISVPIFIARLAFRFFFFVLIKFSKSVVVHSQTQKAEVASAFPMEANKINVVNFGIEPAITSSSAEFEPFDKDNRNIDFLMLGYIAPRKGLELVLSACDLLKRNNTKARFVIAGGLQDKYFEYAQHIFERIRVDDLPVEVMTDLSDGDIDYLFKKSTAAVFVYEDVLGASGPLTFAIANGCRVICNEVGIFGEMKYPGIMHVKQRDPNELAGLFLDHLNQRFDRADLQNQRHQLMKKNSWKNYVKGTFAN